MVSNLNWEKYINTRCKVQKKFLNLFLRTLHDKSNLQDAFSFTPNSIYHSVSFSNHENYTPLYEQERNFVTSHIRSLGWDIWAPYEKTNPGKSLKRYERKTKTDHGLSPEEIVDLDFSRILTSEVVVYDYNLSSNGIGQELQVGFFLPKIVYSRKRPSMLTGGFPGTLCIYYDDAAVLSDIFRGIFSRKSYNEEPFYVKDGCVFKGDENLNQKYKKYLWSWD
ncbi:hypothetical protein JW887_01700 [Candidatus Dojkabacteria bacterium]|nr:hypothetical protein [Candidatus Dojkabacteria bacterium]